MTEEWLDFIVKCRNGESHDYEIVEDAMKKGDDTVFTLYKKNEKTIHFTIYSNGNVDIEYIKES